MLLEKSISCQIKYWCYLLASWVSCLEKVEILYTSKRHNTCGWAHCNCSDYHACAHAWLCAALPFSARLFRIVCGLAGHDGIWSFASRQLACIIIAGSNWLCGQSFLILGFCGAFSTAFLFRSFRIMSLCFFH